MARPQAEPGDCIMNKLDIALSQDTTTFAPRDVVAGTVRWDLGSNPHRIDVSLLWHTSGKGTRDVGVAETLAIDNPGASGLRDFSFDLPEGPYSFSGKLVSLAWAVEATCFPGRDTVRREIVVSPTGRPITLCGPG
jgi:hypothetical protein